MNVCTYIYIYTLFENPRVNKPDALLQGSGNFRVGAFSATFSSPHTFDIPPYDGPIRLAFTNPPAMSIMPDTYIKVGFSAFWNSGRSNVDCHFSDEK